MAAEDGAVEECVLLNRITVEAVLDGDGDPAIQVAYTAGIQISEALGLLEYAKHSLLQAYDRGREG
jgi:hypothetical protein